MWGALAKHTTATFVQTQHAVTLLNDETPAIQKEALQNWTVLDILTAAQGGTCALIKTEC